MASSAAGQDNVSFPNPNFMKGFNFQLDIVNILQDSTDKRIQLLDVNTQSVYALGGDCSTGRLSSVV